MSTIAPLEAPRLDDQTFRVVINGRTVYEPLPKQRLFHETTARYPLYGGAAGGGKSHCLRWHLYLVALSVPGLKCLLLRRKLLDLERSHERFIPQELAAMGLPRECWQSSKHTIALPNGSIIELGHCQHEEDITQYLSAEYDLIAFDELVTFTEYQYLMISSRCRTTIPGFQPRVLGATNPGGPEASWVRRRWVDRDVTEDEDAEYRVEDYAYIPATLDDNTHLNQAEYARTLNRLAPELRRAFRDGDWNVFLGQFFPEFRRPLHVVEFEPMPPSYQRVCGIDWGYAHEGVCLWTCLTPEGYLDVEDEYVFNGPRRDKQIVREVAAEILRRHAARGLLVKRTYADPALDAQRGHDSGETMLETFRKYGVRLTKADNDRTNGWARLRAWLRTRPDGAPFIRIHPRCGYLIRTFGQVVMDEDRPEDVDTDGPDHALDTLRYIVMGRPAPAGDVADVAYPPGTVGHLRQQLAAMDVQRRVLGVGNVRRRKYAY